MRIIKHLRLDTNTKVKGLLLASVLCMLGCPKNETPDAGTMLETESCSTAIEFGQFFLPTTAVSYDCKSIGCETTKQVLFANQGCGEISIFEVSLAASRTNDFSLGQLNVNGTAVTLPSQTSPLVLAPETNGFIDISYIPTDAFEDEAGLVFKWFYTQRGGQVSAAQTTTIPLISAAGEVGQLSASESVLQFGYVPLGTQTSQTIILTNTSSTDPVRLARIEIPTSAGWLIIHDGEDGAVINPSDARSIQISVAPNTEGPLNAVVRFIDQNDEATEVQLLGTSVDGADITSTVSDLFFSTDDNQQTQGFQLMNQGGVQTDVVLSVDNPAFELVTPTIVSIGGLSTADVEIRFMPPDNDELSFDGQLTYTYQNGAETVNGQINLVGEKRVAVLDYFLDDVPFDVLEDEIDMRIHAFGEREERILKIVNNGTAMVTLPSAAWNGQAAGATTVEGVLHVDSSGIPPGGVLQPNGGSVSMIFAAEVLDVIEVENVALRYNTPHHIAETYILPFASGQVDVSVNAFVSDCATTCANEKIIVDGEYTAGDCPVNAFSSVWPGCEPMLYSCREVTTSNQEVCIDPVCPLGFGDSLDSGSICDCPLDAFDGSVFGVDVSPAPETTADFSQDSQLYRNLGEIDGSNLRWTDGYTLHFPPTNTGWGDRDLFCWMAEDSGAFDEINPVFYVRADNPNLVIYWYASENAGNNAKCRDDTSEIDNFMTHHNAGSISPPDGWRVFSDNNVISTGEYEYQVRLSDFIQGAGWNHTKRIIFSVQQKQGTQSESACSSYRVGIRADR